MEWISEEGEEVTDHHPSRPQGGMSSLGTKLRRVLRDASGCLISKASQYSDSDLKSLSGIRFRTECTECNPRLHVDYLFSSIELIQQGPPLKIIVDMQGFIGVESEGSQESLANLTEVKVKAGSFRDEEGAVVKKNETSRRLTFPVGWRRCCRDRVAHAVPRSRPHGSQYKLKA